MSDNNKYTTLHTYNKPSVIPNNERKNASEILHLRMLDHVTSKFDRGVFKKTMEEKIELANRKLKIRPFENIIVAKFDADTEFPTKFQVLKHKKNGKNI